MKKTIQKYALPVLLLCLTLVGCLFFARMKSGLFIDEVYSYGLSNSHYAPFLTDAVGGDLRDGVVTRQQLTDYLVVNDGERFDFGSVYYNQVNDVHPPLYYWLLNAVCSLTPNVFSFWSGLLLDLAIYLWAAAMLYALLLTLFEDRLAAAAGALVYTLSAAGFSTMLMIRMYVLMTALTVQLALLAAKLIRGEKKRYYPLFCLTLFLGLMTQYYFVFYAFFLCAGYVIWRLGRKEWKQALIFALWAFAGVGLLVLAFPACLDHLFAEKLVSGGNAMENLLDTSQYRPRLSLFIHTLIHGMHAAILAGAGLFAVLLLRIPALRREGRRFPKESLVVLIPAVPTLLLVAIISPVVEVRYVYNIVPLLAGWVALLFALGLPEAGEKSRILRAAAAGVVLVLALWQGRAVTPDYLYIPYRELDAAAMEHADAPCIYLDDNYFSPLTEDIQQLRIFDEVFVTAEPESDALREYLAAFPEAEEAVVYIDVSGYWSSGFDAEEMLARMLESTAFTGYEHLYTTGLSQTYLLKR